MSNKKKGAPRLAELLSLMGMTQNELAKRTGLTQAAISHIINGDRDPALSSILKILRVLPVKFEKIWGAECGEKE
jgi:predicted transcriptional regulator